MQKNPKVPAIGIRLDPLKLKKMLRCVTFETSRTGYETFPKIHEVLPQFPQYSVGSRG